MYTKSVSVLKATVVALALFNASANADITPVNSTAVGSVEAWKHGKFPWMYPTTAHEVPSSVSMDYPRPGTVEALRLAKNPGLYRTFSEKVSVQGSH